MNITISLTRTIISIMKAYLNEDDDILYNHDHIYAEQDFDQL